MQVLRPVVQTIRSASRASPIASSSRTRLPPLRSSGVNDRYLIIRDFFTRQSLAAASRPSPILRRLPQRRYNSTSPSDPHRSTNPSNPSRPEDCPHCHAPPSARRDHAQNYTPFIRRLIQQSSLPLRSNYRPSKEELLGAASSWWQRLRIRIKWFTIRGWRRFNTDDLSAFASWFVVGNTLWILIGTTTFVSAVFATLNSLSLQEYVARWISDYMTSETGVTVIFESAIVPKWGASAITFRNVYISRRPSEDSTPDPSTSSSLSSKRKNKTQTTTPPSPIPFLSSSLSPNTYYAPPASDADNYTMFDVNLDEVEVTLSFMRWLDGKGLIKDAKIKGVRGVIDRRSVWWDTSKPLIPLDYRHEVRPGDFELESLAVEDALLTIYQPGGQRPFNVSVFNAAIGPFRKRWLFYDMMAAEAITGQFDNCLFSLHMPQKLGKLTGEEDGVVKRMARFRVDGLPVEHAQYATGHTGPVSWITSGKLDAVLDIKFPFHPDEQVDFRSIFEEIGRNVGRISQGDHPDVPAAVVAAASATGELDIDGEQQNGDLRTRTVLPERAQDASDPIAESHVSRAKNQAAAIEASTSGTSPGNTPGINPGASRLARPPLRAPADSGVGSGTGPGMTAVHNLSLLFGGNEDGASLQQQQQSRQVTIDIDLRFRDLKAAVPLYTTDLSVTNNALIRPIVAFINANRTLVPIHCRVAADLTDFDGSWTLFETGLMTSISDQIYAALAHHVSSEAANTKRLKQVSIWGIQQGVEALLDTLRNVVDPVHGQLLAAV